MVYTLQSALLFVLSLLPVAILLIFDSLCQIAPGRKGILYRKVIDFWFGRKQKNKYNHTIRICDKNEYLKSSMTISAPALLLRLKIYDKIYPTKELETLSQLIVPWFFHIIAGCSILI